MPAQTIPLSEAQRNLPDLIADVAEPSGQPVLISVDDQPAKVLISAAAYEDYLKTKYRDDGKRAGAARVPAVLSAALVSFLLPGCAGPQQSWRGF